MARLFGTGIAEGVIRSDECQQCGGGRGMDSGFGVWYPRRCGDGDCAWCSDDYAEIPSGPSLFTEEVSRCKQLFGIAGYPSFTNSLWVAGNPFV